MDIDVKSLTEGILRPMNLQNQQHDTLSDMLAHTAVFCFSKGFDRLQIETICSILASTVRDDFQQFQRGANASFKDFQEQILLSSSDRIPKSRGIFSPVQAVTAVDFVLRVYYARFQLYKHTLSAVPDPLIGDEGLYQDNMAGIEEPVLMPPLSEGILIELLGAQ